MIDTLSGGSDVYAALDAVCMEGVGLGAFNIYIYIYMGSISEHCRYCSRILIHGVELFPLSQGTGDSPDILSV